MQTANLRAIASNPGKCAMASCCMEGNKIFEGDGMKLLACSQGHAEAVLDKIAKAVAKAGATVEQRNQAIKLHNERQMKPGPNADIVDDYEDIM